MNGSISSGQTNKLLMVNELYTTDRLPCTAACNLRHLSVAEHARRPERKSITRTAFVCC